MIDNCRWKSLNILGQDIYRRLYNVFSDRYLFTYSREYFEYNFHECRNFFISRWSAYHEVISIIATNSLVLLPNHPQDHFEGHNPHNSFPKLSAQRAHSSMPLFPHRNNSHRQVRFFSLPFS